MSAVSVDPLDAPGAHAPAAPGAAAPPGAGAPAPAGGPTPAPADDGVWSPSRRRLTAALVLSITLVALE